MEVTLRKICKGLHLTEYDVLSVKRKLKNYKETGEVFFDVDISSLDLDTPFQLYYCQLPNSKSEINPFPVPFLTHHLGSSQLQFFENLKECFDSYYPNNGFSYEDFLSYMESKPYIGKDYVWYKKSSM